MSEALPKGSFHVRGGKVRFTVITTEPTVRHLEQRRRDLGARTLSETVCAIILETGEGKT